jgi:hypothetical protein
LLRDGERVHCMFAGTTWAGKTTIFEELPDSVAARVAGAILYVHNGAFSSSAEAVLSRRLRSYIVHYCDHAANPYRS